MSQRDRRSASPLRRTFLLHGFAITGAAVTFLARRAGAAPPQPKTRAPAGAAGNPVTAGYQETPHVRHYYAKARQ